MIGVTYGAPTEFQYLERLVPEEAIPPWDPEAVRGALDQDDLYVDITVAAHEIFQREGNDVILAHELSVAEAILGTKLDIPTLDGEQQVKVPAGTQPGDEVRLRGKGFPNLRGFGRGAQIVRFRVAIPTKLSRKGRKLVEELRTELSES